MIGHPPGSTHCDWCHETLAWEDAQVAQDSEYLCPSCWPAWLAIIGPESTNTDQESD